MRWCAPRASPTSGELGWEIYVPTEFMAGVYEEIVAAGPRHGLVHAGYHALNSLRIEKAYRHFGHDITDEDTPWEAGLGFAVKLDKPGGFIGREALLRSAKPGSRKRLVQFQLESPEPLLYHNEPIWQRRCHRRLHPLRHVRAHASAPRWARLRDGPRRRLPRPAIRWTPTPTRSRWRASATPPSPRCAPCTTPRTSASSARRSALLRRPPCRIKTEPLRN